MLGTFTWQPGNILADTKNGKNKQLVIATSDAVGQSWGFASRDVGHELPLQGPNSLRMDVHTISLENNWTATTAERQGSEEDGRRSHNAHLAQPSPVWVTHT